MRTFILFAALIGVMGMSLATLEARRTATAATREAQAVKDVCAHVDGDVSVHRYATDEVFFLLK